ncbi:hypothetical protein [Methylobacterium sp. CM6257]
MDLSNLDTTATAEAGATMEVVHPATGAPLTQDGGAVVSITLAGQDSERYRKADRRIANKRLQASSNGQRVKLTAEGIESDNLERLVACTIAWNGIGWGGADKECTPENAREAYKRLPWLREQAEAFTADRANFLKA